MQSSGAVTAWDYPQVWGGGTDHPIEGFLAVLRRENFVVLAVSCAMVQVMD